MSRLVIEALTKAITDPPIVRVCLSVSDQETGKPVSGITQKQVKIVRVVGDIYPVIQVFTEQVPNSGFYFITCGNSPLNSPSSLPVHEIAVLGVTITTQTGHGQTIVDVVLP